MSSIAKETIPEEAYDFSSYNGLNYEFSLIKEVESPTRPGEMLPKGKWYTGAHGSDDLSQNKNVDDGYAESCKNEDFRLLYAGTEPIFHKRVFHLCKNWTEAKKEESRLLLERSEEIKNGMSFNDPKTLNFIDKDEHLDRNPCKKILDEVLKRENNKWGITYQPKKKYTKSNYQFVQVKEKIDATQKSDVKIFINEAKGVVKLDKNPNIEPVLVFEKRGMYKGEVCDLVVNGNVTAGAIKSKDCKAQEVPEIRIPYEENKHLNEAQYRYIGLTLNKKPTKKITQQTGVIDATKYVHDHISKGGKYTCYDTKETRKWLKNDWNLGDKQVNTVMQNVADKLFKKQQEEMNRSMPDYDKEDENTRCDELRGTYPNYIIFSGSAKMIDKLPMRIMEKYDQEVEECNASIPKKEPRTKVKMVLNWRQSKTLRDNWVKKPDGGWIKFQKMWEQISDIEIQWEEMQLTVDDKKGASDIAIGDE
jgi:hypothetical protein